MGILRISNTELNPESEHRAFRNEVKGAGAIVAFTGIVRGEKQESFIDFITLRRIY